MWFIAFKYYIILCYAYETNAKVFRNLIGFDKGLQWFQVVGCFYLTSFDFGFNLYFRLVDF